jgi:hypothetical protein
MAGSGEQAKRVYEYTTQFWYCVPGLAEALLDGDPLQSETRLKNGVTLSCVPASRKPPAASTSPGSSPTRAARRTPAWARSCRPHDAGRPVRAQLHDRPAEHVPRAVRVLPGGLGPGRGARLHQYKWDVYDCMAQCRVGSRRRPTTIPQALSYCRRECPLTESVADHDAEGRQVGEHSRVPWPRPVLSRGHLSRDNVIKAKLLNRGTDVWAVEHECKRPTAGDDLRPGQGPGRLSCPRGDRAAAAAPYAAQWASTGGGHAVAVLAERAWADHVVIREGRVFDSKTDRRPGQVPGRAAGGARALRGVRRRRERVRQSRLSERRLRGRVPCLQQDQGRGHREHNARYFNHGKLKIADHGHLKT